jgi:hypothetical protein
MAPRTYILPASFRNVCVFASGFDTDLIGSNYLLLSIHPSILVFRGLLTGLGGVFGPFNNRSIVAGERKLGKFESGDDAICSANSHKNQTIPS